MFRKLVINFWVWWYFVELPLIEKNIMRIWLYTLGYLNIVPMLTNLFTPLYQDYTFIGRVIGFLIRSNWVIFGSIIFIFLSIPIGIIAIIPVFLPFVPLLMLLTAFI